MTASLPYPEPDGSRTSGHSGGETSKERAVKNDKSGRTSTVQRAVLEAAAAAGLPGVTIKDLRLEFPEEHHGTLSGALTALHQDGRLARLKTKRDRCSLYVLPINVLERETVEPAQPKKRVVVEADRSYAFYNLGLHIVRELDNGADEVVVRWAK